MLQLGENLAVTDVNQVSYLRRFVEADATVVVLKDDRLVEVGKASDFEQRLCDLKLASASARTPVIPLHVLAEAIEALEEIVRRSREAGSIDRAQAVLGMLYAIKEGEASLC